MAEIKASGDDIINCGENIMSLCDEYITQVNNLFDSITKLNQVAWSGNAADTYVAKLRADRSTYVDFGDYLKMYGQHIKSIGTNVNTIISNWEAK